MPNGQVAVFFGTARTSVKQRCLDVPLGAQRRYCGGPMSRAFSLVEIMIVVVIIAVVSAIAIPGIRAMAARAEGDRALRENAVAVAAARDNARGRGVCLDYIVRRQATSRPTSYPASAGPVGAGPYEVDVWVVTCPGDPVVPGVPGFIFTRDVADSITQVTVRSVIGDVFGAPTDRVHFQRDGSLYDPVAKIQVDAVVNGVARKFKVFPAAGTIEIEEQG